MASCSFRFHIILFNSPHRCLCKFSGTINISLALEEKHVKICINSGEVSNVLTVLLFPIKINLKVPNSFNANIYLSDVYKLLFGSGEIFLFFSAQIVERKPLETEGFLLSSSQFPLFSEDFLLMTRLLT